MMMPTAYDMFSATTSPQSAPVMRSLMGSLNLNEHAFSSGSVPSLWGTSRDPLPNGSIRLEGAAVIPPLRGDHVARLSKPASGCDTVYVAGLPFGYNEDILRQLFVRYGNIASIRSSKPGRRPSAWIQFSTEDAVHKAVQINGFKMRIDGLPERDGVSILMCDYAKNPTRPAREGTFPFFVDRNRQETDKPIKHSRKDGGSSPRRDKPPLEPDRKKTRVENKPEKQNSELKKGPEVAKGTSPARSHGHIIEADSADSTKKSQSPKKSEMDANDEFNKSAQRLQEVENELLIQKAECNRLRTKNDYLMRVGSTNEESLNREDSNQMVENMKNLLETANKTLDKQAKEIIELKESSDPKSAFKMEAKHAAIVALVSNFLLPQPNGASPQGICDYMTQFIPDLRSADIKLTLDRFPQIFRFVADPQSGVSRWQYVAFETFSFL